MTPQECRKLYTEWHVGFLMTVFEKLKGEAIRQARRDIHDTPTLNNIVLGSMVSEMIREGLAIIDKLIEELTEKKNEPPQQRPQQQAPTQKPDSRAAGTKAPGTA